MKNCENLKASVAGRSGDTWATDGCQIGHQNTGRNERRPGDRPTRHANDLAHAGGSRNNRASQSVWPIGTVSGELGRVGLAPPTASLSASRERASQKAFRDAVCELTEKTVAFALAVPLSGLKAKTRSCADIAFARQVAMYLCHTTFSLLMTEVGLHFGRDRTTVAHACKLVEDKRDDAEFDLIIDQLESLLSDARDAIDLTAHNLQVTEGFTGGKASQ